MGVPGWIAKGVVVLLLSAGLIIPSLTVGGIPQSVFAFSLVS